MWVCERLRGQSQGPSGPRASARIHPQGKHVPSWPAAPVSASMASDRGLNGATETRAESVPWCLWALAPDCPLTYGPCGPLSSIGTNGPSLPVWPAPSRHGCPPRGARRTPCAAPSCPDVALTTSSREHHPLGFTGPGRDTGRPCGTRIRARLHRMPLGGWWGSSGRASGSCLVITGSGLCYSGGWELREATRYRQVRMWVWFRDMPGLWLWDPPLSTGALPTVRSS